MNNSPQAQVDDLDQQIKATEREIRSTENTITELAQQIEAGQPVGPDAIPERRRLREHLQHVVSGLRSRHAQAQVDARLHRLQQVRAEVDAYIDAADDSFAELVDTAQRAQAAIIETLEARQVRIAGWARQLNEEDVPRYQGGDPEPSPAHAGLAYGADGLAAGVRRLPGVGADGVLDVIRSNAQALARGHHDGVRTLSLVRTASPLPEGVRFFADRDGQVSYFDPDKVPVDFLRAFEWPREITRAEAILSWHGAGSNGHQVDGRQAIAAAKAAQA